MNAAIIVAAGTSRRMGFDKLLSPLAGRPILLHSIAAFAACEAVDEVIVVCPEDRFDAVATVGADLLTRGKKPCRRVEGGADRHLSVHGGLRALPSGCDLVAIHDGARPLIEPATIAEAFKAAAKHSAVSLAHRINETVKRTNDEGEVRESLSRENLWAMETPQIFAVPLILEAYDRVIAGGHAVTDEVSAVQALGRTVTLIENRHPNPKITYPEDLRIAEALLFARGE